MSNLGGFLVFFIKKKLGLMCLLGEPEEKRSRFFDLSQRGKGGGPEEIVESRSFQNDRLGEPSIDRKEVTRLNLGRRSKDREDLSNFEHRVHEQDADSQALYNPVNLSSSRFDRTKLLTKDVSES